MKYNRKALETFLFWISERHKIYIKRFIENKPKPWTTDDILLNYKFTNVFRRLDKGTEWLVDNFIDLHSDDGKLLFFNIFWYRHFNFIPTGEALGYLPDWDREAVREKLYAIRADGGKVFTSAHMVTGHGGGNKVDIAIDKVISPVWDSLDKIYDEFPRTIEGSTKYFMKNISGVESFGAYELATDLTYYKELKDAPDRMTWANQGPGATRGANYIFGKNYNMNKESDYIFCLRWLLYRANLFFKDSPCPRIRYERYRTQSL